MLLSCPANLQVTSSADAPNPTEHRSIFSLADRARVARRNRARSGVCLLQRGAQDSGEALHTDDHGVHRYGWTADDHSAAAVLREGLKREWLDRVALPDRRGDYHRFHRHLLHGCATVERAALGKVF